jgi:hypothetical protein
MSYRNRDWDEAEKRPATRQWMAEPKSAYPRRLLRDALLVALGLWLFFVATFSGYAG